MAQTAANTPQTIANGSLSSESRAALEEESDSLFGDVKRLREWSKRLEQENVRLKQEVEKLEKKSIEDEVVIRRYEATMVEKGVLAEPMAVSDDEGSS